MPMALATRRDSDLQKYLTLVRAQPVLSPERQAALFERYRETGDEDAARELVVGNLRLVVKIALRYHAELGSILDLVQEGNVGLMRAIARFDPSRGVPFSAYARYWIRAMILRYVAENHRLVSVAKTRAGRRLFFELARERQRLRLDDEDAGTAALARSLGVDAAEYAAISGALARVTSFDAPTEGSDPYDRFAAPGEDPERHVARRTLTADVRATVLRFAEGLTCPRQHALLHERLLADEPVSLADLGRRFAVTRERMRQIEAKLKRRLKEVLLDELGAELEEVATAA